MSILLDKTCPKCGAKDTLQICLYTATVSCSKCLEIIRILTDAEMVKLNKKIEKIVKSITFIDK